MDLSIRPRGRRKKFELDEVLASDALLLGRVTYERFAAAWPSMTDEVGFADKFNSMPKYVVSKTLEEAGWNNSTVIKGDVAEEVSKLKRQPGGDIMVNGSRQLIRALMEHDLVDEYRLMVFPIVLGAGERLFDEGSERTTLRLVATQPVGPDGVVVLTYEPVRNDEKQPD